MKSRTLRIALGIYLALLIASWLLSQDRTSPLSADGGWQEVAVDVSSLTETKSAALRYRKRLGTDLTRTPVLLIHGSPQASSSFNLLLQRLPSDRTYLIPDLPGFGHSKYEFTDYTFSAHADALSQLLEAEGVLSAHIVAYGQGGGAALKLLSLVPDRIASLTLLSSIGVLEHELTGDYFLNQLIYAGQWIFFQMLDWGVPHFGVLDECLLNTRYAESFYFSDMRPLRSIIKSIQVPTLILHGEIDRLVPKSAALEHFRIIPQSTIFWGKGGHMMLASQPEFVSHHLQDFFSAVDDGRAQTRSNAEKSRLIDAAKKLQEDQRVSSGPVLFITLIALGVGTLVSEDLTCITAGLLAARGFIPLSLAMFACFFGIWIGDMMLYAVGRYGGGCLLSRWPFRKLVSVATIESARIWLNRRGGATVLISRFMPGTRLPLYLAAGLVKVNVFKMMIWFAFAGALWAFPVVGLVAYFGHSFSEWLIANGWFMLPGILIFLLISLLLMKMVAASLTHEGRRKLLARYLRIKRWEFWPPYIFYIPIFVALIGTIVRKGKPLAFTSCNPGIPHSGIVGESKKQILDRLDASGCVPKYRLIPRDAAEKLKLAQSWMIAEDLSFPLVIKPDSGERGEGVRVLNDQLELENELQQRDCDTILQAYVSGLEFGILYIRHPDQMNGSITSLTRKIMTSVVGDGHRTLEELILNDSRAFLSYKYFFESLQDQLSEIPQVGQLVTLAPLGSHCRGSLFLNGADLITPELEAEVDRVSKFFEGFHLGRFDVRCPSESDLKHGVNLSVIELNGVTSEPTHIYHPHTPLRIGLKAVIRQWQAAHEIGLANIDKGARMSSLREIITLIKDA